MATVTVPNDVLPAPQLLLPPAADGRVRFSRAAYRRMFEAGMFGPEPRVELIDGELMMMSPIGPLQGAIVRRLTQFFVTNLPDSIECSVQLPIIAAEHSEPEPDIALVRRRDDDYQTEHPSASDIVLAVEVSQSSLSFDLGKKLQLYASCGIKEYWVIDVARQTIIVNRDPHAATYASTMEYRANHTIAPNEIPNCELAVGWLFR